MEWIALGVWVTVLLLVPLAAAPAIGNPLLGVQAVAAGLGVGFVLVFILADGPSWTGWAAAGCAIVGILADAGAWPWLASGDRQISAAGEQAEEVAALVLPFEVGLFALAVIPSLLMALQVETLA